MAQSGGFYRQPILDKAHEDILRADLEDLWVEKGYNAYKIAEMLEFGVGIYKHLQPFHVWYYREKFGLKARKKPPHKKGTSRYNIKPEDVPILNTQEILIRVNKIFPKIFKNTKGEIDTNTLMTRAYIFCHIFSPLRVGEILSTRFMDIIQEENIQSIEFNIFREKKLKPTLGPFNFPLSNRIIEEEIGEYINRLIELYEKKLIPKERLIFPFTRQRGWVLVKMVHPEAYPHFYRFKYCTELANDPDVPITDIKAETMLGINMINKYIMAGPRERLQALRRREKRMQREEG